MAFNFYAKFGAVRGYEAERLFQRSVRARWSFNKLQRESMKVGLSYKRKSMEYDLRRTKATFYAKSITTREESARFFEKFYEPKRIQEGWTSDQTTEFFRKGRLGMLDTMEEMEDYEDMFLEVAAEYPEKYG